MFCCNEDLPKEKSKKSQSHKIQNSIRIKPQRQIQKQTNLTQQIEALKILHDKQLEQFKQFRRNLKKEAQQNKEEMQLMLQKIDKTTNVEQIGKIKQPQCSLLSINKYFFNSEFSITYKAKQSPQVEEDIIFVYKYLFEEKKKARKIIICLEYYAKFIIDKIQNQNNAQQQNQTIKAILKQIDIGLYKKMEQLVAKVYTEVMKESIFCEKNISQTNKIEEYKVTQRQYKDKLRKIQQEVQQLRNKNFQLSIQLQNAKERLQAEICLSKERLKDQTLNAKQRLKQQMQNAKQQKQNLKLEFEESKGRLKLQLEETKQRFKLELQQSKQRLKRQFDGKKELLQVRRQQKIRQNIELENHINKINEELQIIKSTYEVKLMEIKKDYEKQILDTQEMFKLQIQMLQNQKEAIKTQKTALQRQKESLQTEICSFNDIIGQLQQQIDFFKNIPSSKKMHSQSEVQIKTLFNGKILANKKQHKKFLIESIKCHMDTEILTSEKLYDFKRDQKMDFHHFINKKSNLVLIVQTQSALFACYYSGIYNGQKFMDEEALIISLDNSKVYKLNNSKNYPNKKPIDKNVIQGMIYDKQSLIFGNAQVRIHKDDNIVFSNFGTSNCYFNPQGHTVGDLLNEGDINEVELINYEIHEASLGQKQFKVSINEFQLTP